MKSDNFEETLQTVVAEIEQLYSEGEPDTSDIIDKYIKGKRFI